ncbi:MULTISPECIES: hypothetical protein [Paenibacillus]|uniref:Phage ABA sandwich domain-containing protein n=1 Tax=Paenibacillus odorifer TaxID=189426 RepID=A0ABX3HWU0_9BACL|nr:hypothetical protein [Paenibacillus odorifer]OMD55278.1 hypothetical protein BSK51_04285 [Paenibacillus odorifer]
MTQVKDKTDQQLNQALAELVGYSVVKYRMPPDPDGSNWSFDYYMLVNCEGIPVETGLETEEEAWAETLDYCNDPAASLEVQAKAIADNKLIYLNALLSLVSPGEDIQFGLGGSMEVVGYNIDGTSAMLTASPRERAEAAYITLQGAKGNG